MQTQPIADRVVTRDITVAAGNTFQEETIDLPKGYDYCHAFELYEIDSATLDYYKLGLKEGSSGAPIIEAVNAERFLVDKTIPKNAISTVIPFRVVNSKVTYRIESEAVPSEQTLSLQLVFHLFKEVPQGCEV